MKSIKGSVLDIGINAFPEKRRDAVASLYPTAEEARIPCAIVDAAAKVRDLNFKYMAEGKGAPVTARFGPTASRFAIRTARAKARARCFRRFTTKRFEWSVPIGHMIQEPTTSTRLSSQSDSPSGHWDAADMGRDP